MSILALVAQASTNFVQTLYSKKAKRRRIGAPSRCGGAQRSESAVPDFLLQVGPKSAGFAADLEVKTLDSRVV
jgi:hypothetical protein